MEMGERALVVFKDHHGHSPTVYLHWSGHDVGRFLAEATPGMRPADASYSCARFVGYCHEQIPGRLSLGVTNTPEDGRPSSPGDAGVFIVDTETGEVETYGGYGFGDSDPELPLIFGRPRPITEGEIGDV